MGSTDLLKALDGHTVIGIDTAPIIYYFEENPHFFSLMQAIILYAEENDECRLITSPITLAEVFMYPIRQNRQQLVETYKSALLESKTITVYPMALSDYVRAAELRAKYNIKTPDALQIAGCLSANCDIFVTNDIQLRRVTEIEVLVLADFLDEPSKK